MNASNRGKYKLCSVNDQLKAQQESQLDFRVLIGHPASFGQGKDCAEDQARDLIVRVTTLPRRLSLTTTANPCAKTGALIRKERGP